MAIIMEEGAIKIEIYNNQKNIDIDCIREEFEADISYLLDNEINVIKSLN